MPEIFDKKFFLKTGYKVTEEPREIYSQEIQDHLAWSYELPHKKRVGSKAVKQLKALIEKYPHIKEFRNHLVGLYQRLGQKLQARKEAEMLLKEYPDYDFAKFSMIEIWLQEDNYEAAINLMGTPRKIENFAKEEIIHLSLFRSFQALAARLDIYEGKVDEAEERLSLLDDVEPDNGLTKSLRFLILAKRMEQMRERMAESERITREVESFPTVVFEQTDEPVSLTYATELASFFETGWEELPDNFEQILALPREALIADLEGLLLDSLQRHEYFERASDSDSLTFSIHAAYFLGFLESEKSLDIILNIFRQGEDYLDFWYGDMIEVSFRPVLFKLIKSKKEWDKLAQFLLEDNIHFEAKTLITDVLKDLILAEKMPREEGLFLFKNTIKYIFDNLDNDNFIDTKFISSMISDIANARLVELLPLINRLYDKELVDKQWAGKQEVITKDINKAIHDYDIRIQPATLEEFYNPPQQNSNPEFADLLDKAMNDQMLDIITALFGDDDEKEDEDDDYYWGDDDDDEDYWDDDDDEKPQIRYASEPGKTFVKQEKKVGRNDPCPCGSGKKYKKCHGKN